MARCMKFPPPGYVWNGVSGDAVSQFIKVRSERAAAEKRMKKVKRRRKKEEEEEELEEGEIRESKCSDDHHKHKKMMKKVEFDIHQMIDGECENQLLERSNLTEELEQTVFDSFYDSSDSTKNIKQKKEQSCCFITRTDIHSDEVQEKSDSLHSSLQRTNKATADWKDETASTFMSSETCLHYLESQYTELIVNFVPSPIQIENPEFDNQGWLFERKLSRSNVAESSKSNTCIDADLPHGRSLLYPCAQYLIQGDIPALPHTALF